MEGIIATMPGGKHERPDAPADMPEAAAAVWRDAVSSMKKMHFSRETHALLTRYCNAMATCSRLEAELARTDVKEPNYGRFLKELNTTSTTALSYARALRLTPKSNLGAALLPVIRTASWGRSRGNWATTRAARSRCGSDDAGPDNRRFPPRRTTTPAGAFVS